MRPSLFLLLFAPAFLSAQDLHFSQAYHNPMHLNPSRAGAFRGDWRASGLCRSQWTSVPVSYQTFSGAFEWKPVRRGNKFLGLGFQLQNDEAGDAALRWTELGGNAAIAHAFDRNMAISAGFGMKFVQRSFDIGGLKFKNQWGGDVFNANLPTKENFSRNSDVFTTLSTGVNLHYEPSASRTCLDIGGGIFHFNRPNAGFRQDKRQTLATRFAFVADGYWQMGERLDLMAFAVWQEMSNASAKLLGGGLRQVLVNEGRHWAAIQASVGVRLGDALIPAIQLERNTWIFGLSYDLNVSDFNTATNRRGGPEIAVTYKPRPVPPPKVFKSCPIF